MANLSTVTDMIEYVLYTAGQTQETTDFFYDRALEHINRARLELVKGVSPMNPKHRVNFKWAKKYPPYSFVIQPEAATTSISITQNSATVTFSSTIATSMVGYRLIIDNEYDVYRVATHTAGTDSATIDTVFTGTTNAAAGYKLVKIEYELGSNDIIRLISPMTIYRSNDNDNPVCKIYGVDDDRFDADFPIGDIQSGVPDFFKIVYISDANWTIMLNKYSDSTYIKVEYDIIQLPDDLTTSSTASEILIPKENRQVCCDWASSLLLADKTDNKAIDLLKKAQAGYEGMILDSKSLFPDLDPSFARFISREDNM